MTGEQFNVIQYSIKRLNFTHCILSYQKNAKIASERFKDQPMSPAESVVFWTEYILRHNGALHLKSHAQNLVWYQYFLVVVLSAFLFIALVFPFIIYYGLKLIYKCI